MNVHDLFPLLGDSVAADMVVLHLTRAQSMTTRSPLLYVRDGIEQHAPDAYLTALVMLEFIFLYSPSCFLSSLRASIDVLTVLYQDLPGHRACQLL